MKMQLFILISSFSLLASGTQRNPQIRTCQQLGGEFSVAQTANDQIGFCHFDQAVIGALDLMAYVNDKKMSQSIHIYRQGITDCSLTGQVQTLTNLEGVSQDFCVFGDQSYIDNSTLLKGKSSPDNQKLNQALGL